MSLTGKPELATSAPISNDGFWPDLNTNDLLSQYRIPSEYVDAVITRGLVLAMIRVNEKLEPVKAEMQTLGYTTLAEYTAAHSRQINAIEVLLTKYQHAVFCRAKAGLLQQFKTMNRRPQAENEAKESEETEQYWLDESQACIQAFFDALFTEHNVSASSNVHAELM